MPLGIYDTAVLTRVVNRPDIQPPAFLLDTFFRQVQTSEDEWIYFDVEKLVPRLAPFVAGDLPGKLVELPGFDTNRFKPAYVKPKSILDPKGALKRQMGEALAGSLSPEERQRVRLNNAIQHHLTIIKRREEVMAAEALKSGKVTVKGDGFDTTVVDFKRDAALTVVLAGGDLWSANTSDPLGDLEARSKDAQSKGGAPAQTVVMDPDAWAAMRAQLIVRGEDKYLFQYDRSSTSRAELGPSGGEKVRHIGVIGDFDIWVYEDTYVDDDGNVQAVMGSGQVIGASIQYTEGTRCYGMIEDEDANLKAEIYFAKSWTEKDPGKRWLLTQSAPLMVPYRPNVTWSMKVL